MYTGNGETNCAHADNSYKKKIQLLVHVPKLINLNVLSQVKEVSLIGYANNSLYFVFLEKSNYEVRKHVIDGQGVGTVSHGNLGI